MRCPLEAVDRRLGDVHRAWHDAEKNYFVPDDFRFSFQTAIQSLRSVTFVLQNNKSAIPNFDAWYRPWQDSLDSDPLMRWVVNARNIIEKQGDLETRSLIRADIVASYLDEGPRLEVPAHLFEGPAKLIESIPTEVMEKHVRKHGILRIQRRWVESNLPGYELLEALAVAYGRIAELVLDAHRQTGLDASKEFIDHDGNVINLATLNWRLPCMVGHEKPRELYISLADGAELTLKRESIQFDKDQSRAIAARYGETLTEVMVGQHSTYGDLCISYFKLASSVFEKDKYHLNFLFLFHDKKVISVFPVHAENKQQKYLLMRHFADEAAKIGADAALLVGESWLAPRDPSNPYLMASESPEKTEILSLCLASKAGDIIHVWAPIIRENDSVELGEVKTENDAIFLAFIPFLSAWKINIPSKWLASQSIDPGKSAPEVRRALPRYAPSAKSPCLCGSGRKYSRCCSLKSENGMRTLKASRNKSFDNPDEALLEARADLTSYMILHKSHTEPFLKIPAVRRMLEIDLKALYELVERLMHCHHRLDRKKDFEVTLERLKGNVRDPRWRRKMQFFQVLNALGLDWDQEAGIAQLKKLGSLRNEEDEDILQVALDLLRDDLGFSDKIYYADRIVFLSKSVVDRLHYRTYKGLQYFLVGDFEAAKREVGEGVADFNRQIEIADATPYQKYKLATAYNLLGSIVGGGDYFAKSLDIMNEILNEKDISEHFRSAVRQVIAEVYKKSGQLDLAIDAYRETYSETAREVCKVFIGECLLRLTRIDEAAAEILNVDVSSLDKYERFDYSLALAAIAVRSGKSELLELAKDALKAEVSIEPYFRQERDRMLISVIEAISSGPSDVLAQRVMDELAGTDSKLMEHRLAGGTAKSVDL